MVIYILNPFLMKITSLIFFSLFCFTFNTFKILYNCLIPKLLLNTYSFPDRSCWKCMFSSIVFVIRCNYHDLAACMHTISIFAIKDIYIYTVYILSVSNKCCNTNKYYITCFFNFYMVLSYQNVFPYLFKHNNFQCNNKL